jgi:hypothetical protein
VLTQALSSNDYVCWNPKIRNEIQARNTFERQYGEENEVKRRDRASARTGRWYLGNRQKEVPFANYRFFGTITLYWWPEPLLHVLLLLGRCFCVAMDSFKLSRRYLRGVEFCWKPHFIVQEYERGSLVSCFIRRKGLELKGKHPGANGVSRLSAIQI